MDLPWPPARRRINRPRPASTPTACSTALARAGFTTEPPRQSTLAVLDTFDGRIADADLRLELVDGRQLVLRGEGQVPAVVTVATQPRVAADVPAGPLRQRLARLLDVRALLRLVEVTSQRTEATKRNRAGKVTAAVTVHRDTLANGGSFGLDAVARRGDRADRIPEAGRGAAASCSPGSGSRRSRAASPTSPRRAPGSRSVATRYPSACRSTPGCRRSTGSAPCSPTCATRCWPTGTGRSRTSTPSSSTTSASPSAAPGSCSPTPRGCCPTTCASALARTSPGSARSPATARDLDVYQIEWPDYTADLDAGATEGAGAVARAPRRAARGGARRARRSQLTSARAAAAIEAWSEWLDGPVDPATLGDRGDEELAVTVRRRIRRAHRRMIERGRTITPATPAETVHELRKDAKKLRYLIECFGGLYDKSARSAFVSRLKALQDTLGDHQDAEVHAARSAGDRRRPAAGLVRRHAAGDRSADRAARAAPGRPPRRARRPVRRLRQQGHPQGAEGAAGERRAEPVR